MLTQNIVFFEKFVRWFEKDSFKGFTAYRKRRNRSTIFRLEKYLIFFIHLEKILSIQYLGDSDEKIPRKFFIYGFGIFWIKRKFSFQFFLTQKSLMPHIQQWFYLNSTFQSSILLKLLCLHNQTKVFNQNKTY